MRGLTRLSLFDAPPDAVLLLFAVLTQLGDAWFLLSFAALFYWIAPSTLADRPRRVGATLVALALAALMLTIGLKNFFDFPRPPGAGEATVPTWLPVAFGPVFRNIATGTGFGFPSGHALGTTVVYGGCALLFDVGTRRQRALVAAAFVALVSLSRLVLGVHFVGDVVAGVTFGLAFLAVVAVVVDRRPARAFGLAVAVAAGAVLVTTFFGTPGERTDAVVGLGGALGGLLALKSLDDVPTASLSVPAVLCGLVVAGGSWLAVRTAGLPAALAFVAYALTVGLLVSWPSLVSAVRRYVDKRGASEPS